MTRLALALAAFLLLLASPAAAQWDDAPTGTSAAFVLAAPMTSPTLGAATAQHRAGAALIATGLMANAGGAIGAFFSLLQAFAVEGGACDPRFGCSRDQTDWGALFGVSIGTSAFGLALFFVGLGLDIHAHVLRGHAGEVRLSGNGLSVSF